jgi:hypothetical protein
MMGKGHPYDHNNMDHCDHIPWNRSRRDSPCRTHEIPVVMPLESKGKGCGTARVNVRSIGSSLCGDVSCKNFVAARKDINEGSAPYDVSRMRSSDQSSDQRGEWCRQHEDPSHRASSL